MSPTREARCPSKYCAFGVSFGIVFGEADPPFCRFEHVYPPATRIALNVPLFEGPSPTRGENSTSPVIKLSDSNFPLHTNVPASRPTLPSGNSTAPESVTEFPSPRVHFTGEGVAGPHTFNLGSRSKKVPFPESCASKRNERWFPFAKVISTFHLPIRFGDCASAWAVQPMCAIAIRINACVAFTFSPKPNLLSAQGESVFRTLNCPTTNPPPRTATARQVDTNGPSAACAAATTNIQRRTSNH